MVVDVRPQRGKSSIPVHFQRLEMDAIMNVYGRMVASGEWRDYALNMHTDRAVFSIFRRTAEMPVYRIEKNPALAKKQGAFSILSAEGVILKRGHELKTVLSFFDRKKFSIVS
ncbi:DUF2794 domain-containing protein [Ponticaulis sp.]|uniref:DUF2794 domain-containing protein n=1 Tax=Ponticaulis sp. TaxID=2020902 RepID=UPI000B6E2B05|nr:DUF2794 domain-containing protein [Ponticaulis sp.]MAI89785.1 hypothetical protein [Ponticaulis sp.]OUX99463.1 MAG: hypothetical protein CBB65_05040 [Hyphomonadaceae bacterium TMED5]|tara:strand:+ start:17586 stop:17924 length:339 start_codon:yes stop_codon:yes gene_type:complete